MRKRSSKLTRKNGAAKRHGNDGNLVHRISSSTPEARDEGPRLIPWKGDEDRASSHVDYLVDLADIALGRKKKTSF